jgi:signal transduction histidine kinase
VIGTLTRRPIDLAVAVLTCVAFVTLTVEAATTGHPLPAIPLGAAFTAIALAVFPLVRRRDGRHSVAVAGGYLLALLVLGFAVFGSDTGTGATLLLMVVVSQAVLLLPLPLAALVTALVPFVHAGMSMGDALRNGLGVLAAAVFTAVVTGLLQREHGARVELDAANRRLRELAAQTEELATAQERNRVARDIHDGLGHHLTVVRMQLEAARAVLLTDQRRAGELLTSAQDQTSRALDEVRHSVAALREPRSRGPLVEALEHLAAESSAAGVSTEFTSLGSRKDLPPDAEEALFRVAEEGLTNVRKHARATTARLVLDYRGGGVVRVDVSDDGIGPTGTGGSDTRGFGLSGLGERLKGLNGVLVLEPRPDGGATLRAEVPS